MVSTMVIIRLQIWRRSCKRAILENAKQTYVLVDSSKIGQTCFAKVAPLKRAIVITSQGHELLQAIKKKTEVIEV